MLFSSSKLHFVICISVVRSQPRAGGRRKRNLPRFGWRHTSDSYNICRTSEIVSLITQSLTTIKIHLACLHLRRASRLRSIWLYPHILSCPLRHLDKHQWSYFEYQENIKCILSVLEKKSVTEFLFVRDILLKRFKMKHHYWCFIIL